MEQDPQSLINEHFKAQKKTDPLYMLNDPALRQKMAKLEVNFG